MIVLHHLVEMSLTTELSEPYGFCFFTLVPGQKRGQRSSEQSSMSQIPAIVLYAFSSCIPCVVVALLRVGLIPFLLVGIKKIVNTTSISLKMINRPLPKHNKTKTKQK